MCYAESSLKQKKDIEKYLKKYNAMQLRWDSRVKVSNNYEKMNFGNSKGLAFDRVLIYPTKVMESWIKDNSFKLNNTARAKLYVGITRARYSVGIVIDHELQSDGLTIYNI